MDDQFEQLKQLLTSKFEQVQDLQNGDYVIIVKEEIVYEETGKRNYELGIGKVMRFPARLSINGKTYRTDELGEIKDGAVTLFVNDIGRDDGRHFLTLVRVPKLFYRAVDEASWAGKLKSVDDVLAVVEEFKP